MPSYTYRAISEAGQPVDGVLTAENYQVALRQLEEKSLFPVKVSEGVASKGGIFGKRRVKGAHLTTYYGQLADLLRAGVPMLRSLDVLSKQGAGGVLSQAIRELREDVAGGMSLGDAMGKHPHVFSELHASMVRAGESGGFLEDVLQRIAIFCEREDELKNKIIGSMIYPCILVAVGGFVLLGIMMFVVPQIREHLRVETFNVLTHIVFGAYDAVAAHYLVISLGIAVAVAGVGAYFKSESGRRAWAKFKLRAPMFGKIFTMMAVCRFCRILGTMLHNGVPILQALRISKESAGSVILAEVIGDAADSVRKGASLSQPLGESGLFPSDIVNMISVAEESNNLEVVLVQIADANEVRTARQVDLAVRVLEPLLLVAMAANVMVILLALLLPMLSMGEGVG